MEETWAGKIFWGYGEGRVIEQIQEWAAAVIVGLWTTKGQGEARCRTEKYH